MRNHSGLKMMSLACVLAAAMAACQGGGASGGSGSGGGGRDIGSGFGGSESPDSGDGRTGRAPQAEVNRPVRSASQPTGGGAERGQRSVGEDRRVTGHQHEDVAGQKVPVAKDDREFAAMIAEHHTSAVEMGRFAAAHARGDEVRRLAEHIRQNQEREQVDLERRALEAGGPAHMIDPRMRQRSQRMVDELHTARRDDINRLFLTHMMAHHRDGVEMVRGSMANLMDPELRGMAEKMLDDQKREIEQMRGMQTGASGDGDATGTGHQHEQRR